MQPLHAIPASKNGLSFARAHPEGLALKRRARSLPLELARSTCYQPTAPPVMPANVVSSKSLLRHRIPAGVGMIGQAAAFQFERAAREATVHVCPRPRYDFRTRVRSGAGGDCGHAHLRSRLFGCARGHGAWRRVSRATRRPQDPAPSPVPGAARSGPDHQVRGAAQLHRRGDGGNQRHGRAGGHLRGRQGADAHSRTACRRARRVRLARVPEWQDRSFRGRRARRFGRGGDRGAAPPGAKHCRRGAQSRMRGDSPEAA